MRFAYLVPSPVHPRACGEHWSSTASRLSRNGSSPRLRGTRRQCLDIAELVRFIPAPAGNTSGEARPGLPGTVHPRACGEHSNRVVLIEMASGSSPRLRGTHAFSMRRGHAVRFIPAPAGSALDLSGAVVLGETVRPRACGEHARTPGRCTDPGYAGSSPRLRSLNSASCADWTGSPYIAVHPRACGELHDPTGVDRTRTLKRGIPAPAGNSNPSPARIARASGRGSVPAPAGNTNPPAASHRDPTVHPRACGEHYFCPSPFGPGMRIHPRVMLGTREPVHGHGQPVRFIPRACGEHEAVEHLKSPPFGSSPRLRGTLSCSGYARAYGRFIPAPAGNTSRLRPYQERNCPLWSIPAPAGSARPVRAPQLHPPSAVHPRACGEHICLVCPSCFCPGSSPRLRGTLPQCQVRQRHARFIPAPAGNTACGPPQAAPHTVHPRACGEHGRQAQDPGELGGSSPRLRGTLVSSPVAIGHCRFIPAPAGNTIRLIRGFSARTVHPRGLRGTQCPPLFLFAYPRFIPAPAGNTTIVSSPYSQRAVHPRACGEHLRGAGL